MCPTSRVARACPGVPSRKYTYEGMVRFLKDPLHVRPSGRMPNPNLSEQQVADVAAYLLGDIAAPSGLDYAYFEGSFNSVKDLAKATAKERGPAAKIDLSKIKRNDQFGLQFNGIIQNLSPNNTGTTINDQPAAH